MRQLRLERTVEDLSVSLEGYDWQGCTFRNCEILVTEGDFSLVGCDFANCHLTLSGKAEAIAKVVELFMQGKPIKFLQKKEGDETQV